MKKLLVILNHLNISKNFQGCGNGRSYTKEDMEAALDALRDRSLSLTRASEKFGIPPTTLWQVNLIFDSF